MKDHDKKDPLSEKHSSHGNFEGTVTDRRTTDVLFFFALICVWVITTILGAQAVNEGNIYRILNPINDQGQICGYSEGVTEYENFYSVLTNGVGVCTKGCGDYDTNFTSTNPNDYYCLHTIYNVYDDDTSLSEYIASKCFKDGEFYIKRNCGCMIKMSSRNLLHRCTLKKAKYRNKFRSQKIQSGASTFWSDVYNARDVVFGFGIMGTIVLGFLWIHLLRSQCLSSIVIWGCILGVLTAFLLLFTLALETSQKWENDSPQRHSDTEIGTLRAFAALLLALSLIWAIGICVFGIYILAIVVITIIIMYIETSVECDLIVSHLLQEVQFNLQSRQYH
jgi:hypothetical protein